MSRLGPGPLDGIRVVEVAVWHAGPGAGAILADLGAEVVKVESPEGDPERTALGSYVLRSAAIDGEGWSLMFDVSNRGKKSISLDLTSDLGGQALRRLVAGADVFLTNLRPSTKQSLMIDWPSLSKVNPRLVHVNVTGFGSLGERADHGAFDTLGQAASGMMWIMAGDSPVPLPAVTVDQMTASMAAHATTIALLARERQGIAQDVHVSLYGSALSAWHSWIAATSALGALPSLTYDRRRKPPLLSIYRCADDRWIVGTNPGMRQWAQFCALIGRADLTEPVPDLADDSALDVLYAELDPVLETRTAEEWTTSFVAHGLRFAPINTFEDVLKDPQALENGYLQDVDHAVLGRVRLPGFPILFGAQDAGFRGAAPRLGEHNDETLPALGFTDAEITRMTTARRRRDHDG
jgi:crotonobetainyl-CoA:carnitine CoA-transferase CaiB-like acyl-CoA transferase